MSILPQGKELVLALLCLFVGGYVIVKYCLDQFEKPNIGADDGDPWKFLITRFLTTRQQYLAGFSVYCGIMLAIFLVVSLFPGAIMDVVKAIAATAAGDLQGPAATASDATLQSFPTFPILVAFYIVGLNPNLPKMLDFEVMVRRLGHRVAYIPKNVDKIFNYMRFSEFDLSDEELERAWQAADLRRAWLESPDLKTFAPIFNRAVVLYTRAAMLAGDIPLEGATDLPQNVNLEVFKQYRSEIQNVGVNLQAVNARLSEYAGNGPGDGRHAMQSVQRDLVKSLELLYVIFAAATTTKGAEQLANRLRAIGFTSAYPPAPGIPWDPILKVMGAGAVVMLVAYAVAAATLDGDQQSLIPTTPANIVYLLSANLAMHLVAIWQALRMRSRLIGVDKYFNDTGRGSVVAYLRIFLQSGICAWLLHLLLYSPGLVRALGSAGGDALSSSQILVLYLKSSLGSLLIPGTCGLMTTYALDHPSDTRYEKLLSGVLQGGAMAAAALAAVQLTIGEAFLAYHVFVVVLYGGLGFVLGYLLPAAVKRHWRAQEANLPEKIGVLRTTVLQHFHNIQDFMEWLNASNSRLGGRRPLDVLTEESGLQKLVSLVVETRSRVTTPF